MGGPVRSTEARVVEDFLTSASTAPSALVIEGDPGIGKTTLWLSALDQARERGFAVLAARASATDSVLAYASLADLLVDAGLDATQLPDPQRLAVDRILLAPTPTASPPISARWPRHLSRRSRFLPRRRHCWRPSMICSGWIPPAPTRSVSRHDEPLDASECWPPSGPTVTASIHRRGLRHPYPQN
jgi:hypothetical protein